MGVLAGVQLGVFVAAVLTLVAAIMWRQAQRHRTAVWYRTRLRDADPAVRADAVRGWIGYGLHRSSRDLLALAGGEREESVLAVLAEEVRKRAWEPPSRPEIGELRRWGSAYHHDRPAAPSDIDPPETGR